MSKGFFNSKKKIILKFKIIMYSLKEKLKNLSKYFQENIAPITGDKCELMDLQRNIFYFSKFSFQSFILIKSFISKENFEK